MSDFSLRFPFKLRPGHEIRLEEEPTWVRIASQELELSLVRKTGGTYVANIVGFPTMDDASAFAANMWAALAKILIDRTVPFDAPFQVTPIQYLSEPTVTQNAPQLGVVHGAANEDEAVAYPSDQRIAVLGVGTPTVSVSTPGYHVLADLARWAARPYAAKVPSDERLRTAIELYSASFAEFSRRARLLTLVMVMEVLTDHEMKHPAALALLNKWQLEIDDALERTNSSDEHHALESLKRELFFRRENSIRSRVRKLVQQALAGDPRIDELARQAVDAYDKRGTLVHDGALPEAELARATENARFVVQRVLGARIDSILGRHGA